MKKLLIPFLLIFSIFCLTSCEEEETSSSSDPYLFDDTSVVVYTNQSVEDGVLRVIVLADENELYITSKTVIYEERSSGSGFDIGSIWSFDTDDTVEYYYYLDDIDWQNEPNVIYPVKVYIYKD